MSEDIAKSLESLRERYGKFEDEIRLNDVNKEVSDLVGAIRGYPAKIADIRSRGYAFRKFLEHMAEVLQQHWVEAKTQVDSVIQDEQSQLRAETGHIQESMGKAMRLVGAPEKLTVAIQPIEHKISEFENKVTAAKRRIRTLFETVKKDSDALNRQITEINGFLDIRDGASFKFLMGESLYMVSRAEWVAGNKDTPNGHLYLTDHRLIFEQNEKVGKTLGMFGGKQIHEMRWEVSLNLVEGLNFENKGLFGGKDMVHLTLKSGAPYPKITVEVKGGTNNKFWIKQIERMIAGETDDERAIQPDPEMLEALKNAPTACHVCGATLPMLVGGQRQIECEYCGSVIRIG